MKMIDQSIREALAELRREAEGSEKGTCPPEEILSLFHEGRLSEPEKALVQEHLSLCPSCLEVMHLEAVCAMEPDAEGDSVTFPEELMQHAKELVKPGLDKFLFDFVARFWRGSLEVIQSSLEPLSPFNQPAAVLLRSEKGTQEPEPLRVQKSFERIAAELEMSVPKEGLWNIQIFLKGVIEESLPEGLRVNLKDLSEDRELHSTLARGGMVSFQEVSPGEYALEVKEKGSLIGTISVCLS